MSLTPKGLPYPLPTAPVAAGANDIKALAEGVDGLFVSHSEKDAPLGYVGLDASGNASLPGNLVVTGAQMIGSTLYFGSAYDTNLYRAAAGQLRTDGSLVTGDTAYLAYATADQVVVGNMQGKGAGLAFGNAGDTNLYRSAAGYLKTDGHLQIAGSAYFGAAADTNLYRSAASTLATDGKFRSATLDVATDAIVGNVLTLKYLIVNDPAVGARQLELGPPDSAGAGYRAFRCPN